MNKIGPNDYWRQIRTQCVVHAVQKYLPDVAKCFPSRTWHGYVKAERRLRGAKLLTALKAIEYLSREKSSKAIEISDLFSYGPAKCQLWKVLDANADIEAVASAWNAEARVQLGVSATPESSPSLPYWPQEGLPALEASNVYQSHHEPLLNLTRSILEYRAEIECSKSALVREHRILKPNLNGPVLPIRGNPWAHPLLCKHGLKTLPSNPRIVVVRFVRSVLCARKLLSSYDIDHRDIFWAVQNLIDPQTLGTPFSLRKRDCSWIELTNVSVESVRPKYPTTLNRNSKKRQYVISPSERIAIDRFAKVRK